MASRRAAAPRATDDETPILPRDLATHDGLTADDYGRHRAERDRWLTAHGVDPHDWPRVHEVLTASWRAHGIVTARERLRVVDMGGD